MTIVTNKGTQNLICVQLMRTTNKLPIGLLQLSIWSFLPVGKWNQLEKYHFSILNNPHCPLRILQFFRILCRYAKIECGMRRHSIIACNYFFTSIKSFTDGIFSSYLITLFTRYRARTFKKFHYHVMRMNSIHIGAIFFFISLSLK